jgi:thiol-disulfide isomerase/thioredoxin
MRRPSPTVILFIFFVLLDSLALYAAYVKHKAEYMPTTMASPVPSGIVWEDFNGKKHDLKDLKGHVLVLHFWAAWCPPCREEFPRLMRAAADNKDITFLTLSSDSSPEKAKDFLKDVPDIAGVKAPANLLYGWDATKSLTFDQFGVNRYPETIVADSSMRMRRKFPSPVDWDNKDVRGFLDDLRQGKEPRELK